MILGSKLEPTTKDEIEAEAKGRYAALRAKEPETTVAGVLDERRTSLYSCHNLRQVT
jgi:hypothetical protein